MEKLLDIIKENDQFKQYVSLVENYKEIPCINKFQESDSYKSNPRLAMLENLNVNSNDDEITFSTNNLIGTIRDNAELLGKASYTASFTKEGENLVLTSKIDARLTNLDNTMFDQGGTIMRINEPILEESFVNTYEGMGNLISSKAK